MPRYSLLSMLALAISLFSNNLTAQKRFNVSIHLSSNLYPDSLKITYDNGVSEVNIKPVFKDKMAIISGIYYSPFAEIIFKYPNGTSGDSFGSIFFINQRKAKIVFLTTQRNSNPFLNFKAEGILSPDEVGKTDYQQFISAQQQDFSEFLVANRSQMNDSLVAIVFAKSGKLSARKIEYIQQNPQKYYAFRVFRKEIIYTDNVGADSLFRLFQLFDKQWQKSEEGKEIVNIIQGLHLGKNDPAPDIIAKNTVGETVSSKSYYGKYILLNFWASWCGPCLAEMPVITGLRKHYSPDDLVMIFITQDTDSTAFAKAVMKYRMEGVHLFSNSDLIRIYGAAIPKVFVIDPAGQIVYSRAEEKDFNLQKIDGILSRKIKRMP